MPEKLDAVRVRRLRPASPADAERLAPARAPLGLWALVLLHTLCGPVCGAHAGEITLEWPVPCYQADSLDCSATSAVRETTLAAQEVTAIRYGSSPDTLAVGEVDQRGKECGMDSTRLVYAEHAWLVETRFRSRDEAGNRSCGYASYLAVFPDSTYGQTPARPRGLAATYYDLIDFTGPTVVTVDSMIDFVTTATWPSRIVGPLAFSARWTGYVATVAPGIYTWCVEAHDRAMLWIGGVLKVDHWVSAGTFRACGTTTVAGQEVSIKLDYAEQNGQGQVRLKWRPPGGVETVVPASALSH